MQIDRGRCLDSLAFGGAFITELIRRGLEDERRWDDIEAALGAVNDSGHDWDDDPAAWVRSERRRDVRRAG